jgi:hypothetical protein
LTPSDESAITENDLTPSDDEDITEDDLTPSEKTMVSEESEEEPRTKVESEDESNDDDNEWECKYLGSETGTVYMEESTVACSEEDMITTLADCEKALYDLSPAGYTWMGQYSHAERSPGCRYDSRVKNFAFNTYKNPKNTTK